MCLDIRQAVIGVETSDGSVPKVVFIKTLLHTRCQCSSWPFIIAPHRSEGVYHCCTEVMGLKQTRGEGGVQKLRMTETGRLLSHHVSKYRNDDENLFDLKQKDGDDNEHHLAIWV